MANPKPIVTPFAENGTRNDIPEAGADQPQLATMSGGWGVVTQTPINEGGIPPERADFNGLGYLTTSHLAFLNRGQWYGFDATYAGQIGGYPLHARLQLDNGDIVQSAIPNNTNNPNVNMTGWVLDKGIPTFESISGLPSVAESGDLIFVKSYHLGLNKGGGTFVYNSDKSSINDGVVCFNGWVRSSFIFITSAMAGCYADGINDDQPALQRGVYYCGENKLPFYIDEGIHLCKTANFFRWGSENQYQTNCQILDVKHNDLKIIGKSKNSIIKYDDGITYIGWDEVGYVGARLFSTRSPNDRVDGFELIGLTLDGNGFNNKIRGVNAGGTSAGNQAVYIFHGNNNHVKDCVFKDFSGYQVVNISYDTYDTIIEGNIFLNAGWLDGTNWTPGYTDQSTIYLGGSYTCTNNALIQQTAGMFAGTAFELHGNGLSFGNRIEKYACTFLSAAVVVSANNRTIGNTALDCTILQATDTQNGLNNQVTVMGNYFRQNTQKNPAGSVYDLYRTMFYFLGFNAAGNCGVDISNNVLDTDGLYVDSTDSYLKTSNSVVYAAQLTSFTFTGNTIKNHKGSFIRLARQKAGILYSISNNTFDNCGVDNSTDIGNSLVFYDNDNDQSYGVRPNSVEFNNNTFKACKYGQYFGSSLDVAGFSISPYKFTVDNDIHDNWITTLRIKPSFDVASDMFMSFDYKVSSTYDLSKQINFYTSGYAAANQRGNIDFFESGVSKSYTKTNNEYLWFKLNNGIIQLQATYDPPSIPASSQIEYVFNDVVGVTLGMVATPSFDKYLSGVQIWASVTANQQVVVYFRNGTASAVDIPSGLLKVLVK